jgi:hypothetical protein
MLKRKCMTIPQDGSRKIIEKRKPLQEQQKKIGNELLEKQKKIGNNMLEKQKTMPNKLLERMRRRHMTLFSL